MNFFQQRPDRVTGDMLTFSEQVSWFIQGLIRRWVFFALYTGGSLAWWVFKPFGGGQDSLFIWNLIASLNAIQVEQIVGMAMMNQTRRDALVMRRDVRDELRAMRQDIRDLLGLEREELTTLQHFGEP